MNIQDRVTIKDVYIKPDGQICACTQPVPEAPPLYFTHYVLNGATYETGQSAQVAFTKALKACKESAVPFEDKRLIKAELICHINDSENRTAGNLFTMSSIKEDTFYPLTVEVEIDDYHCPTCGYTHSDAFLHLDHHLCKTPMPKHEKVARLIPRG